MSDQSSTQCPFEAALAPDAPRYSHETNTPRAAAGIAANRAELALAELCFADEDADIRDITACIQAETARGRKGARTLLKIALMLDRLPRLATVLRARAHLTAAHLARLATAILPVAPENLNTLEGKILALITPNRDKADLPTTDALHTGLQEIIEEVQASARPIDVEGPMEQPMKEKIRIRPSRSYAGGTVITATLSDAHAQEFTAILDAICAMEGCDRPEALRTLAAANADVQVSLNLYRSTDGGKGWMPGPGFLTGIATEEYMKKVTSICVIEPGEVEGYSPSENISNYTVGRDGRCMFPYCDKPADRCDKDHVTNYAEGGPTSDSNIQNLCRAHHNLKTQGLWDVTRSLDGRCYWTSNTSGAQVSTDPVGPVNHPGAVPVGASLRRKAQVLAEYNAEREQARAEMAEKVARAQDAQPVVELLRQARIMGSAESLDEFLTKAAKAVAYQAAQDQTGNYTAKEAEESLGVGELRREELAADDQVTRMIGVYLGHADPLEAMRAVGADLAAWIDHNAGSDRGRGSFADTDTDTGTGTDDRAGPGG